MIVGHTVSHYEIIEKIGEGGMGVVYKARDLSLHRLVALKFLPTEITASEERIARFEAEARAISALNHPNIATIHAMDQDNGRRFLVLELLEGGTLRERIRGYRDRDRSFPLNEALSIGIQLSEGLAHAHRKGIVHRDIKPENVMFTADGTLRVTDFGLAKSSHASEITRDGTTVGTAAYMGPEQALRNETSPRGDLFAVGVVIYEMVAGRRPFVGGNELATLHAMLNEPPPPLHLLRTDAPAGLEAILIKLLEKDPSQRFQTGDELAEALRAIDPASEMTRELNYSGITHSLTRLIPVPTVRTRGKSASSYMAAGLALVLLAAASVFFWARFQPAPPPAQSILAVLPFTAKSGSAEDIAFGSGLAGIVAGKLASFGANVVPESDLLKNRVVTPADARRVFGAQQVLTGIIGRQPSGAAHVKLELVDTGTGQTVHSAYVESGASGVSLQDGVLRQAASLLNLSPDPIAMSKVRSENTRTATGYDYYVLGNGYLQRWDQAGNLGFAIASFEKAIRADNSYALAYAGLSGAYWQQYVVMHDQPDLERARDAAIQALSRNESLASPHITLGAIAVTAGQVEEGIRQLRMALDRDPVNAEACRELANALVADGKLSEAEATYKRAIQYRPNFWLGYNDLGVFLNDHARYREAEAALQKAASLTPDNYLVYRNLGGVEMALGKWPEAEKDFRKAIELRPISSVFSNLGTLYIFMGRYPEAVPLLEKAIAMGRNDRYSYLIWGNLGDAYRWSPAQPRRAADAYAKAIDLATEQLAVNPRDPTLLSQIALYRAKAGQVVEAERQMREALRLAPVARSSVLYRSALVYEIAGKRRQSMAALNAALSSGYSMEVVEREPELASLRRDPAFAATAANFREKK